MLVDAGMKLCANANKQTPTGQHNMKKHKSSCKEISPPEVQMNLHEFIGLDCTNRRVCRTLHYSIPSSHIYRNNGNLLLVILDTVSTLHHLKHSKMNTENNQSFQMGRFSYLHSPYELHTIVKLGRVTWQFSQLAPIPKPEEGNSSNT